MSRVFKKCVLVFQHASDATTVESITYTENNIQRDGFCRKSGPNEQSGLPEIYSNLSQICKCDVCNIYFANFSILSKHKLSKHSSIECSICKKPCSLPEHKLLHIRRKKKYQCVICNQTFTSKTSFITHKSTHKGEKPVSYTHLDNVYLEPKKTLNLTQLRNQEGCAKTKVVFHDTTKVALQR